MPPGILLEPFLESHPDGILHSWVLNITKNVFGGVNEDRRNSLSIFPLRVIPAKKTNLRLEGSNKLVIFLD